MNKSEKLQFLSDRIKKSEYFEAFIDGKWQQIRSGHNYAIGNGEDGFVISYDISYRFVDFNTIMRCEIRAISKLPVLTDEEKQFLKHFPQDWWIARDGNEIRNELHIFAEKPYKSEYQNVWLCLSAYAMLKCCPLFTDIKWSDEDCYTIGELRGHKQ